jgi:hypothetical protein
VAFHLVIASSANSIASRLEAFVIQLPRGARTKIKLDGRKYALKSWTAMDFYDENCS